MTMPSPEQWEAEERRRQQELNDRHQARVDDLFRDPEVPDNETPEAIAAVKSSDDLVREAAGVPQPEPGHDVAAWAAERWPVSEAVGPEPVDRDALKAEIKAELLAEIRNAGS